MKIAGVDEVGRGALAGPVITAAVILDPRDDWQALRDSKQLTPKQREHFYVQITEQAIAWAIGRAEPEEIDRLNIRQATLLAMQRAVSNLSLRPSAVWVDGRDAPVVAVPVKTVVGGDATVPCISAASIVAKVTRDREVVAYHERYPRYGFDRHKGYGTEQHRQALMQYGPCPHHRHSFAPLAKA